jgi:D-amino-acid dehydrogenase
MYEVIVIGGGIVGASAAYHLGRKRFKTLLIDRKDEGRATYAGAGILAPHIASGKPEAWRRFATHAVGYYPALFDLLREDTDADAGYNPCGMLVVAMDEDETAPFDAKLQTLNERQGRGELRVGSFYEVSAEDAKDVFPPLGEPLRALYYADAFRVEGWRFAAVMQQAAVQRGVEIIKGNVVALLIENNNVVGVAADGGTFMAERVIIAGGAWSTHFGQQLGVQIPVEPQRGQIIHLRLPGMTTANFPIVEAFRGHYLLGWDDDRVVAGATRETGSGFATGLTAGGVHEVLHEALRVAPGLAPAEPIDMRVGLRPYTRDYLPVIGTLPGVGQVYVVTGHGPTGLQLGPYSGKLAADWVAGQAPDIALDDFRVNRFANTSS